MLRGGLRVVTAVLAVASAAACRPSREAPSRAAIAAAPWDSIVADARGTTVTWFMWRGDPSINAYVDRWVAPRLRAQFGITLNPVDAQGAALANALTVQRDARQAVGPVDLVWINGETFFNLREADLLFGPWAARLPNAAAIDTLSPIIRRDFEQDPAGYESPWGQVEFALIYDTVRTPDPPHTYAELAAWIRAHPGRFTHDQGFTGLTFLKGLLYALAGGPAAFQGGFDSARYVAGSARVWAWLAATTPDFWRRGRTYPPDVAALEHLFANGEVDFAMSNNENDVVTKVRQGILPPTSHALVLRDGAIANTHYLGIPFNAGNVAGAMVVANFLLSPAAQYEKARPEVWADGTVLDVRRLPPPWPERFAARGQDPHAVPSDTLARYARPEVAPLYSIRLQADWRRRVRQAG